MATWGTQKDPPPAVGRTLTRHISCTECGAHIPITWTVTAYDDRDHPIISQNHSLTRDHPCPGRDGWVKRHDDAALRRIRWSAEGMKAGEVGHLATKIIEDIDAELLSREIPF